MPRILHYACLKDYDTAVVTLSKHVRSYRISAGVQESLAYVHGDEASGTAASRTHTKPSSSTLATPT